MVALAAGLAGATCVTLPEATCKTTSKCFWQNETDSCLDPHMVTLRFGGANFVVQLGNPTNQTRANSFGNAIASSLLLALYDIGIDISPTSVRLLVGDGSGMEAEIFVRNTGEMSLFDLYNASSTVVALGLVKGTALTLLTATDVLDPFSTTVTTTVATTVAQTTIDVEEPGSSTTSSNNSPYIMLAMAMITVVLAGLFAIFMKVCVCLQRKREKKREIKREREREREREARSFT